MAPYARLEWRLLLGAAAALAIGTYGAEAYARAAIPYYSLLAHWVAAGHPWRIMSIQIGSAQSGPGAVLRLTGAVLGLAGDGQPAAILVSKLQAAAVVESPIVFWACLLLWPMASYRRRLALLALGIPVFLCLEAATTICQLLGPLAYGTAVLRGATNPVTPWEHWSRFLEGGGRVALALSAAILTIALINVAGTRRHRSSPARNGSPSHN